MSALLHQNTTFSSFLNTRLKSLSKQNDKSDEDRETLEGLHGQLETLTESLVGMKGLRDDFAPDKQMEVRLLESRQIDRFFGLEASGWLERAESRLRRIRAGVGDSTNQELETKATNRYPLRKRASAVKFAARLVRKRRGKVESIKIPSLVRSGSEVLSKGSNDSSPFKARFDFASVATAAKSPSPTNPRSPILVNASATGSFEPKEAKIKVRARTLHHSGTSPAEAAPVSTTEKNLPSYHDRIDLKFEPVKLPSKKDLEARQKHFASTKQASKRFTLGGTRPSLDSRSSPILSSGDPLRLSPISGQGEMSDTDSGGEDNDPHSLENLIRPLSRAKQQFIRSSQGYDSFMMKQNTNQPRTPRRLYMQECRSLETIPEPLITKTTKGVSLSGGVSLKNYGMGDKQVEALSASLSVMLIKYLDLSNNRILKESAACSIVSKLDPHILQKLDLSKNRLGPKSIGILCDLLTETSSLSSLGLESANIRPPQVQALCAAISYRDICPYTQIVIHECPLESLNLARNNIDDDGAAVIASMLKHSKLLKNLDLSWNNIRREGAVALFGAINGNSCLESLDVGYNAIGSSQDTNRSAVVALASCLGVDTGNGCSLTHLNVSHNQMNEGDCAILAKALKKNHTLMGIHVDGNAGFIDSRGFLIPGANSWPSQSSTLFSRILGSAVPKVGSAKEQWIATCNCWICERWQEFTFIWDPIKSQVDPPANAKDISWDVKLVTSYDKWIPQKMNYDEKSKDYRVTAMVPPGENQYAFILDEKEKVRTEAEQALAQLKKSLSSMPAISDCDEVTMLVRIELEQKANDLEANIKRRDDPVVTVASDQPKGKKKATWENYSENSAKRLPYMVNKVVIKLPDEFEREDSLPPRAGDVKVVKVGKWKFQSSLFADFSQDSDELLDKSFNKDYDMTRIEKTVAKKGNDDDLIHDANQTKAIMRKHYANLKYIFKSYAASIGSGSEIFSMGKNAYYEFLANCDLVDEDGKKGLDRAQVALIFVACQTLGPRCSFNKKNSLNRFQFLDALVQMAIIKFKSTGVCDTVKSAVEKLLTEHVLAKSELKEHDDYKWKIMYTETVDMTLKKNKGLLEQVFQLYSGKANLPSEKPKTMSPSEWQQLFIDSELMSEGFIDRVVRVLYIRSKETSVDELQDRKARSMNFIEFVHGVCWTANALEPEKPLQGTLQRLITRFVQKILSKRKK